MSNITKRALAATLKRLMEKKPLSKITVTELAQECGINRHTFYYHFRDLYDLVEWICTDEMMQAMDEDGRLHSWRESLRGFCAYALNNKTFVFGIRDAMPKDQILEIMFHCSIRVAEAALKEECPDICLMPDRWKFVVDFYAGAFHGILMLWIEEGMSRDPEELIRLLAAVIHEDGRNVLLRVADVE